MSEPNEYHEEFQALLQDEANIKFFCDEIQSMISHNLDDAYKLIKEVIQFCDENLLEDSKGWMYYYLSWYYFYIAEYEDATKTFEEAKGIFEKNDDATGLFNLYCSLVRINLEYDQSDLASTFADKCISIAQNASDEKMLVSALLNKAVVDVRICDYSAAKDILDYIFINHTEQLKDPFIAKKTHHLDIALELFIGDPNKALSMLDETDSSMFGTSIISFNVNRVRGLIYERLHREDLAIFWYERGIREAKQSLSWYDYCAISADLGNFLLNNNHVELGLSRLKDGCSVADEKKFFGIQNKINRFFYNHYKSIGDNKNALIHLKKILTNDEFLSKFNNPTRSYPFLGKEDSSFSLYKLLFDRSDLVANLGQKIVMQFSTEDILKTLGANINNLVECDILGIAMYDLSTGKLKKVLFVDDDIISLQSVDLDGDTSIFKYCIANKKTLVIDDYNSNKAKYAQVGIIEAPNSSIFRNNMICIPLIVDGQVLGAFSLCSNSEAGFDSGDIVLLKLLCNYIAIALKNSSVYQQMENKAIYDGLTGFYTKKEILEQGKIKCDQAFASQSQTYLFMIDIDNLKDINDLYGHLQGDDVISNIAKIISETLVPGSLAGRYGGDEFLLIAPNIDYLQAQNYAKTLITIVDDKLSQTYKYNKRLTTISIGIYEYSNSSVSFTDAIEFADLAMYNAKHNNKNGYYTYRG